MEINIQSKSSKDWLRLWPLLIPLLILLPGLPDFPFPNPEAPFSDLAISHYPNASYLRDSIINYGSVPLWSNAILSGYPFAANPLSGVWYLPGWLALLFPLPLGFNLTTLLHLVWGGLGMYLFLKKSNLSYLPALFGALAFEALPKTFAHYGAGHLTLLYAVSWTPWLLIAAAGDGTPKRWYKQPGLVLAVIFLADVRWAVYAGMLWVVWELANSLLEGRKKLLRIFSQLVLAAGLSAPLSIPLLEYTRLSTRADLAASDVLTFSLPPARLLGMIFPDFSGFHEWMIYPGIFVLILGLGFSTWRRENRFWMAVLGVSLLYSLGESIPGMSFLARLPGFSLLRVPSRALLVSGFSLAVLAALGFNHVIEGVSEKRLRWVRLAFVGLLGFSASLTVIIWISNKAAPVNFLWGSLFITVFLIWWEIGTAKRIQSSLWLWGFVGFMLIDLLIVNSTLFAPRSSSQLLEEGSKAAQYIASQPGDFRIYSPSYSIPQQTAVDYDLSLANGVDPLQIKVYADYLISASGVPSTGYSIILPHLNGDDPATANAEYLPDADMLRALNVRYIAVEFDLDSAEYDLEQVFGQTRIYSINLSQSDPNSAVGVEYQIISREPNRLTLQAEGPGKLVMAEVDYPGWRVFVDGQETEISAYNGLFRSLDLEAGDHQVELVFQPLSVYAGLIIFGITILGLGLWQRRKT